MQHLFYFITYSTTYADGWSEAGAAAAVYCSDQAEVMSLLLQYGAQVNAVNSSECSALHIAINKQHVHCVRVLLTHRPCDVNVQVNSTYFRCYVDQV